MQVSIQQILHNPIYKSASQMHSFGTGFNSDLVCTDLARAAVDEQLGNIFRYDRQRVENPRSMVHFQPCGQRNGGFCDKFDMLASVEALTYNMYVATKDSKNNPPIFLEFETTLATARSQYVFLGRVVGPGKLAFLSHVVHFPGMATLFLMRQSL